MPFNYDMITSSHLHELERLSGTAHADRELVPRECLWLKPCNALGGRRDFASIRAVEALSCHAA